MKINTETEIQRKTETEMRLNDPAVAFRK